MPITPEDKRPRVKRTVNLHPDVDADFARYCEQLESSPDHVANEILKDHLSKNLLKAVAGETGAKRGRKKAAA